MRLVLLGLLAPVIFGSAIVYWDRAAGMWKLDGDGVCLYSEADFKGTALCAPVGASVMNVDFAYRSVKFYGNAKGLDVTPHVSVQNRDNTRHHAQDWSLPSHSGPHEHHPMDEIPSSRTFLRLPPIAEAFHVQ